MYFLYSPKPLLGLDISFEAITLLELRIINEKTLITNFHYLSFHDNNDLVNSLAKNHQGNKVAIAIPDLSVINKTFQFSTSLKRREIEELIHIQTENFFGLTAEKIHFDILNLTINPLTPTLMDAEIIATKAEEINKLKNMVAKNGFAISAIETRSAALKRGFNFLLKNFSSSFPAHFAFLFLESDAMHFMIVENKNIVHSKIEFLNLSLFSLNDAIKQNLYALNENTPIKNLIIWATHSFLSNFNVDIEAFFPISVEIVNPIEFLSTSLMIEMEILAQNPASFLISLGLALRGINEY